MTRTKSIYLALLAVLLSPMAANADLIGNTIDCVSFGFFSSGCSPASAIVGAGIEFDVLGNAEGYHWSLDIGSSSVIFQDLSRGASSGAHGWVELTGFTSVILGIANFFTDATAGIIASDISFTANSITIDARNSSWSPDQLLSFDVVTAAVPEPGTLALLGIGLAGIGFSRRRKKI